jgi:hypothetical protein
MKLLTPTHLRPRNRRRRHRRHRQQVGEHTVEIYFMCHAIEQ